MQTKPPENKDEISSKLIELERTRQNKCNELSHLISHQNEISVRISALLTALDKINKEVNSFGSKGGFVFQDSTQSGENTLDKQTKVLKDATSNVIMLGNASSGVQMAIPENFIKEGLLAKTLEMRTQTPTLGKTIEVPSIPLRTAILPKEYVPTSPVSLVPTSALSKGFVSEAWRKWMLGSDSFKAIRNLKSSDVKHLTRGRKSYSDMKFLMTVIEEETKARGVWKENPTLEEVDAMYVIGSEALAKELGGPQEEVLWTGRGKGRRELSWQTVVTLLRGEKRKAMKRKIEDLDESELKELHQRETGQRVAIQIPEIAGGSAGVPIPGIPDVRVPDIVMQMRKNLATEQENQMRKTLMTERDNQTLVKAEDIKME